MVGTFDYNKVLVIEAFLVFLFPANVKISKNCSISVQYRWYKDQLNFFQEIYTYMGNLLSVTPLVERLALKDTRKAFRSHRPKDGRKRSTLQVIVSRLGYVALHLLQTC